MSTTSSEDLQRLLSAINSIPEPWAKWPGGYQRMDLALVDAVMSIRFRYGRERKDHSWTGARGAVLRYENYAEETGTQGMVGLAAQDPIALERILNRQKVHAGKTKAAAIVEVAKRFTSPEIGIAERTDVDPDNDQHRKIYTGVKGLGPVTWEYFTMLLGYPGVKADTWIGRFVAHAIGRPVSSERAGELLKSAAKVLGVEQTKLDYAIWSWARASTARRSRRA